MSLRVTCKTRYRKTRNLLQARQRNVCLHSGGVNNGLSSYPAGKIEISRIGVLLVQCHSQQVSWKKHLRLVTRGSPRSIALANGVESVAGRNCPGIICGTPKLSQQMRNVLPTAESKGILAKSTPSTARSREGSFSFHRRQLRDDFVHPSSEVQYLTVLCNPTQDCISRQEPGT